VSELLSVNDLTELFSDLLGCCLHEAQWTPGDVQKILVALWDGTEGWPPRGWQPLTDVKGSTDSESVYVAALKDGTFGLLYESEDYTGHGCQCHSFTGRYASLDDLLDACEPDYRQAVADALKEEK
jgi:hypothetical protein